jgi:glycosyltransferase involved in cell wall biosynthesis
MTIAAMRIAIVSSNGRLVGGTETYLAYAASELSQAGHEVAFWHELDEPLDREPIALPARLLRWCVAVIGGSRALEALRQWRPDVIYAHGLVDEHLERAMLAIAPVAFRAHNYYGTCISGAKTFKSPVITPCGRHFGASCLAYYYPRRCGGLSPVTMFRDLRRQQARLEFLRQCAAVIPNSEHLGREYARHGIEAARLHILPSSIDAPGDGVRGGAAARSADEWRLLFMGRMDRLKGGDMFIDALPVVASRLERWIRVTFAGAGPERKRWETAAKAVASPRLSIDFVGWLDGDKRDRFWDACDLFVLPSLWPEPYGLVGLEAGRRGVPVAAFAVGGIPEWLEDGVNGHLAPGDPPTAGGLADAIVRCLGNDASHARLRSGARAATMRLAASGHISALTTIFEHIRAAGAAR